MKFNITNKTVLADGTVDLIVQIAGKDQIIFCYILESWEGVFNYSTVDKKQSLINIKIAEDFANEAEDVLNYLKDY